MAFTFTHCLTHTHLHTQIQACNIPSCNKTVSFHKQTLTALQTQIHTHTHSNYTNAIWLRTHTVYIYTIYSQYLNTNLHTHTHTRTHIHIHARTHTYSRTHIHKLTSENWSDDSGEQTACIDWQVEDGEECAPLLILHTHTHTQETHSLVCTYVLSSFCAYQRTCSQM